MALLKPPLSVTGASIVDVNGNPVLLAGVNWAGAHEDGLVPAGLDKLHRDQIAARIASWGLNHVRLPFALGTFMTNGGTVKTGPVPSAASLAANPDLAGKSPWEVYQAVVTSLTAAGLAVIPNQHLLFPGWCCSEADNNGLWYNGNWPVATFYACWKLVAQTFAANPLVIGYDLHNEPRAAKTSSGVVTPTWGDGNSATDFRLIYNDVAAVMRTWSGSKLYFCEGLSYAGDLTKAAAFPVDGPGVVYSLHDYSWYGHPAGQTLTAYYNQMDTAGGYLHLDNTAPLWIGEFGIDLGSAAGMNTGWMANFLSYAAARDLHWCWWELSATAVKGTEPVTGVTKSNPGDRASYGLMQGQDWQGSQTAMLALLHQIT